jgi:hypothetical protein
VHALIRTALKNAVSEKNPDINGRALYDSFYMKCPKKQVFGDRK